jgi:carboxyl-terminal processing protease
MSKRFVLFVVLFVVGLLPTQLPIRAEETASVTKTNVTQPLSPGPDDGIIALVTARALEQNHYREQRFTDDVSSKLFDRYLEALDPQRLHFTQEDIAEFSEYRTKLDNLMLNRRTGADTRPAYLMFNRFRERLDQRVAYAVELLQQGDFDFATNEMVTLNRKDEPHPQNLDAARQLWRQRLRSEYLQEKVAKYAEKQKAARKPAQANADGLSPLHKAPEAGVASFKIGTNGLSEASIAGLTKTNVTNDPARAAAEVAAAPKKSEAEEIVDTLTRRYTRNATFYRDLEAADVLEIYLSSLAHVYDPHTDYMGPPQAENFAIGMNLSLFGIGAVLQSDGDGYCKIAELKPGPAMKSNKIKEGDRIVAVAQSNAPPVDVVDMNLNKIVQLVRGPQGTEVRLTVVPPDNTTDRREVVLIREEIKLDDQAAKAKVIDFPTADGKTMRLGVIDLPTFYVPMDTGAGLKPTEAGTAHYTSKDVALLLEKFKKENVQGVILDLRRNGGGSLEECIKLTGLFIKDGPVVQVSGPRGPIYVDEDKDPRIQYDGPLIVMTSRYSASASEILAGALQDYDRALIVGDLSTHGKGTVQQLNPLRMWISEDSMTNNPGTLKITKAKFFRASGASTQLKGVASDIVLPSRLNYAKNIGEESYETALPWNTIPSAKYEKFNHVRPHLAELLSRSQERLATDQEFGYIREDIEQFRKQQALNALSLNAQTRIREWDEEDARQRARDQERRARTAPEPVVYELTLKQVDLPGLPEPVAKTNRVATVDAIDPHAGLLEEGEEDAVPAIDAALEETQRILVDYIGLFNRRDLAAKTLPAPKE